MKKITVGIMAHVDSGKTTLAEALLYKTGVIRQPGRVDHGNTWLDTDKIEKSRGITIFSHQANITIGNTEVTLLDTPGHVDFSAETERTMQVLDYAILVISGIDGVQSHTRTLWNLLGRYNIPTLIFVNKMDATELTKKAILQNLQSKLSANCVDFTDDDEAISEAAATCSELLMETFLENGALTEYDLADAISKREIFPCCFGSARKSNGIQTLLTLLERYTLHPRYSKAFGARVFKISTDAKGNRLTYLKLKGGMIKNRDELVYIGADNQPHTEKVSGIRFYSGVKYRAAEQAESGDVCAVTGLSSAYAGQGLGDMQDFTQSILRPVMRYRAVLPQDMLPSDALKHFRILEEEDPQLNVLWNEQLQAIFVQLMGKVQLEVLTQRIAERFGYDVAFDSGCVTYHETIAETVEGVGHYEPLRHYAEVHIQLSPLPAGSGLQWESRCNEDELSRNWQRLILTHIEEKQHVGVLTGSPITDVKLTLVSGKAHLKHTEGGDFRQATYRAIRQGLASAQSVLLEPYYDFILTLPQDCLGRAMHDIQMKSGKFQSPQLENGQAILIGSAPVAEMADYAAEVMSYTKGQGSLSLTVSGYHPCHNTEEVLAQIGYNFESDLENSPDSVFCSHGAGFTVPWHEVPHYMHLPYASQKLNDVEEELPPMPRISDRTNASDEELMAIYERTYGKINRDERKAMRRDRREESAQYYKSRPKRYNNGREYLLVDGYNIIHAWEDLRKIAQDNLDLARGKLINRLTNYQGLKNCNIIIVFDAYRVKGKDRTIEQHGNLHVVYTKEAETADSYIEQVSHTLAKEYRVRVATSDGLEQIIVLGNGAHRVSAQELLAEVNHAESDMQDFLEKQKTENKNTAPKLKDNTN